mmetsp:Transcript_5288/g.17021  ORF Transcript_5288/g.17021 Transcript_5288/m.17021 type:complete len:369 (-) Transcript_5288:247-1353(-)
MTKTLACLAWASPASTRRSSCRGPWSRAWCTVATTVTSLATRTRTLRPLRRGRRRRRAPKSTCWTTTTTLRRRWTRTTTRLLWRSPSTGTPMLTRPVGTHCRRPCRQEPPPPSTICARRRRRLQPRSTRQDTRCHRCRPLTRKRYSLEDGKASEDGQHHRQGNRHGAILVVLDRPFAGAGASIVVVVARRRRRRTRRRRRGGRRRRRRRRRWLRSGTSVDRTPDWRSIVGGEAVPGVALAAAGAGAAVPHARFVRGATVDDRALRRAQRWVQRAGAGAATGCLLKGDAGTNVRIARVHKADGGVGDVGVGQAGRGTRVVRQEAFVIVVVPRVVRVQVPPGGWIAAAFGAIRSVNKAKAVLSRAVPSDL